MSSQPIVPLTPAQVVAHEDSASQEGYAHRITEEADVLVNVIAGGYQDETISSRLAREDVDGKGVAHEVGKLGSEFLDKFQKDHGATAVAADAWRAEHVEQVEESSGLIP